VEFNFNYTAVHNNDITIMDVDIILYDIRSATDGRALPPVTRVRAIVCSHPTNAAPETTVTADTHTRTHTHTHTHTSCDINTSARSSTHARQRLLFWRRLRVASVATVIYCLVIVRPSVRWDRLASVPRRAILYVDRYIAFFSVHYSDWIDINITVDSACRVREWISSC